jgi:4-hydroxybenzoate polyprenyltransferase
MTSPRPTFEPASPDEAEFGPRPAARPSQLLTWLRLLRLPNVFTALSDVTMGFLFVRHSLDPLAAYVCLAAATALLYTAGMVLNDVFDIDIDTRERPQRPLPSGRIPLPLARALGIAMLALGVLFGWTAGFAFMPVGWLYIRSGLVASLLAACVIFYNAWLKRTPLGPLGMGACRFFNVLLGMSLVASEPGAIVLGFAPAHLLVAGGIGIYIVGVTWFARNEAGESPIWQLLAAMLVMIGGVVVLGSFTAYEARLFQEPWIVSVLLGLLMVTVLRRCFAAVLDPSPARVQAAVKHSILSLIWLDAAIVAAIAPLPYAFGIVALLIPALLLGRWVYST